MATWTRRFLLIPSVEAGPDSLVSALDTSGGAQEASPTTGQLFSAKKYRLIGKTVAPGANGAGLPVVSAGIRLFDSGPSSGTATPRLYGEPSPRAIGNLLVSETGSLEADRYTFNQANAKRYSTTEDSSTPPVYSCEEYTLPGDAQYRQSPVTLGKTKDLLHTTYTRQNSSDPYVSDYFTEGMDPDGRPADGQTPLSGQFSSLFRDSNKYLTRPKLLPLSDGRLMCCWMSAFLPKAMSRFELEGNNVPTNYLWPETNAFRVQIFTSFLNPEDMRWSKVREIDQRSVPINSLASVASGQMGAAASGIVLSNMASGYYAATFFDVVEYEDTGEIVAVWGGNQRRRNNSTSQSVQVPGSDPPDFVTVNTYLNKEVYKTVSRFISCAYSPDGGETWSMRSEFTDNGDVSNVDIPGFTDAVRGGVNDTTPAMGRMILAGAVERLDSGRLIVPLVCRDRISCLVSDNRGATWRATTVREYYDGWRAFDGRSVAIEEPYSDIYGSENVKSSGWIWGGIDVTKSRGGTALIAVTIPDDGFWFNIFQTGYSIYDDDDLCQSRAWHGQSVFVYSTGDGESFDDPIQISNWGCSDTPVLPRSEGATYSPILDLSGAPNHNHLHERNPGGTSVSISMRPDGYVQLYLAAHNWGDSVTGDFLATRTLSVRDIKGGESSEEVIPTYWSQYLQRFYTINVPALGVARPLARNRAYGMLPANILTASNRGSGWLGSVGPPWGNVLIAPNTVACSSRPYTDGLEWNWQDPPADSSTRFTSVYTMTNDPDRWDNTSIRFGGDGAADYVGFIPRDRRIDGTAVLVATITDAASVFNGKDGHLAVWDAAKEDVNGVVGDWVFSPNPVDDGTRWTLENSGYYVEAGPPIGSALITPGAYLYSPNAPGPGGVASPRLDRPLNILQDNMPDPTVFFNGVESVASVLWRGETVVATGFIDMRHVRIRTPNDQVALDWYQPIVAIPGETTTIERYNEHGDDWSSIVVHRSAYWQPLRENLPCSLNIERSSHNLSFNTEWFPRLKQWTGDPANPAFIGYSYVEGGKGIVDFRSCSGTILTASQYRYEHMMQTGTDATNYGTPKRMLAGRAFTFCWDSHTAPEARRVADWMYPAGPFGGCYEIRLGQPFLDLAMDVTASLQQNPIRVETQTADPLTMLSAFPDNLVLFRLANADLDWHLNRRPWLITSFHPGWNGPGSYAIDVSYDNTNGQQLNAGKFIPCISGNAKLIDRGRLDPDDLTFDSVAWEGGCLRISGALVYTSAYEAGNITIGGGGNEYREVPNFNCQNYDPDDPIETKRPNLVSRTLANGFTSCVRAFVCPVAGDSADLNFFADSTSTDINGGMSYIDLGLTKVNESSHTGGLWIDHYQCGWRIMFQVDRSDSAQHLIRVFLVDRHGNKPMIDSVNTFIQVPACFPISNAPDTEHDNWLEVVVSTQELMDPVYDEYSTPKPGVKISAFVRPWNRTGDPDLLQSFTTIAWNHDLTVVDAAYADEWYRQDYIEWGNKVLSPSVDPDAFDPRDGVKSLWKNVSLLRSDTPTVSAGNNVMTSAGTNTPGELSEVSILMKGALGADIQESRASIVENGEWVEVFGALPEYYDGASYPKDSGDGVAPIGPPYFPGLAPMVLGANDSGLINATRGSIMSYHPPQHISDGAFVRWSGSATSRATFAYRTSYSFPASATLEQPVAREWRGAKGYTPSPNVAPGGDSSVQLYQKQDVEILLDAYGEHGYCTDGDYGNWVDGVALGKKFHPTGFAVFGRNWPSCMIELSDATDFATADTYQLCFGQPYDYICSEGGGYSHQGGSALIREPNKYSHLWVWALDTTAHAFDYPSLGPNTFSFSGPMGLSTSVDREEYNYVDVASGYASADAREADVAPWRPGQFKSHKSGPSFFLQIVDEVHCDDTDNSMSQASRARCVFRILDNDATTLYLDANPLEHLPASPNDTPGLGWRVASIFSDRLGTQINYPNKDDPADPNPQIRPGDLRGEGYRYAKITIFGCTHFTQADSFLRCGRIVLGDLYELSAPDFEWGWAISQSGGTNLLTTTGGPRYANVMHAPRRVFQVGYSPLEPSQEVRSTGGGPDDLVSPSRGFGGASPAGNTANKKTWSEVLDMVRRLGGPGTDCALFWEGELAMDAVPISIGRRRYPVMVNPDERDYPRPCLADPENILMVRLTKMGSATHDGFMCKSVQDNTAIVSGSTTAPRPIMSVKSLTFEEDF